MTPPPPLGSVGGEGSPAAEVEIDAALVRSLLAEQHGDLVDRELTSLDAGWDNSLWRLGDGLIVRLPRRSISAPLRAVWDDACRAPLWAGESVWLHGDLHPANVLLVEGVLGGVIDFGDICSGDPATDVAAAWMMLPETSMSMFIDAYGGIDDATLARSRGWAVQFGLLLLDIGLHDKPTYEAVARATLARFADR